MLAGTRPSFGSLILHESAPLASSTSCALHELADISAYLHAPQYQAIVEGTFTHYWEGPSIAQEWKILDRGERPFYRRSDQETYESSLR